MDSGKKVWRGTSILTTALSTLFHFSPHKKFDKPKRVVNSGPTVVMTTGGGQQQILQQQQTQHHHHHHQQQHHQQHQTQLQHQRQQQQLNNHQQCNGTTTVPQQQPAKRTSNDFIFGKVIGEGSFSTVYLTKDIHTNKEYAIKVCDKRHIMREKKTEYVKREKEILNMISAAGAPFFVKLYCTFQDIDRLYFVLTYAKNGELLPHITKVGAFDVECTRFYAAEIVVALEHLHNLRIIHRDLKPENILLDDKMHIMITDFGSAKVLKEEGKEDESTGPEEERRRNSFVGTAQYVSPELLTDKTASPASDLWALGCIIYQMVSGLPPFRSRSEYAIFQKIQKLEYEFPDGFCPKAKDLVQKLLVLNPKERLGSQDPGGKYTSLRNHEFFAGLDWDSLGKATPPPIYPYFHSSEGTGNYRVPDHLEPGLDDRQLTRLLGLDMEEGINEEMKRGRKKVCDLSKEEVASRLVQQEANNPKWHQLVQGNLILNQGLIYKRKGLFPRRRMLLLTLGPHLYYVDPVSMVLKGEIPWSSDLRAEPKNFKIFFVHTPNRTYYLEDPEGFALEWCRLIEEMRVHTYTDLQT